jgi:hypothetical protein
MHVFLYSKSILFTECYDVSGATLLEKGRHFIN